MTPPNADQRPEPGPDRTGGDPPDADALLGRVARGDEGAFSSLYDLVANRVYGLILRVVRDPAQAEEVAQEAMVDVWRRASSFDSTRGSAITWVLTLAHRRAVDRVRSAQSAGERERKVAARDATAGFDEVTEQVAVRLEQQQVRRCLGSLTDLQKEAVTLAYYGGYTYRQVADLLSVPLPTVKTRMRDGLVRLRDCLGVGR
ncbi:MAG: sigma-70 family RNA polymerase sigma factor [Acidimicrobiales bacterium]